jgi:hypothetical protein
MVEIDRSWVIAGWRMGNDYDPNTTVSLQQAVDKALQGQPYTHDRHAQVLRALRQAAATLPEAEYRVLERQAETALSFHTRQGWDARCAALRVCKRCDVAATARVKAALRDLAVVLRETAAALNAQLLLSSRLGGSSPRRPVSAWIRICSRCCVACRMLWPWLRSVRPT